MESTCVPTCNKCKKPIETAHCTTWDGLDLCENCSLQDDLNYKMEKLEVWMDHNSCTSEQKEKKRRESKLLSIKRFVKYLVQASHCRDENCQSPHCQKMKKTLQHLKNCEQNISGKCPMCKQVFTLCRYHSNYCRNANCLVPFCIHIKHNTRQGFERRQQRRIKAAQLRKINSFNQPSPSDPPPQRRFRLKPSTGPPVGALQAVQEVQAAAARQTLPYSVAAVNYGKSNPVVSSPVTSGLMASPQQIQTQMQIPMSHMMSCVPNSMSSVGNLPWLEVPCYAQTSQPLQNLQPQPPLQMGIRQQFHIMGPDSMPDFIGNSAMGPP